MRIISQRLQFRKYNEEDINFLFSLLSDPEMVRYIGEGKTRDKEGTKKFLDWIYSTYKVGTGLGLMVLEEKENNNPIGHAGLVPQTVDGAEELEIGYWISRKYWGKGYATEAAKSLMDYGYSNLGKRKFIALIQPDNEASKKVANKLEMKLEKKVILGGQSVHVHSISK
ncbi:GNAT family N-acetyltransferase [Bacillus spongiae]|uniref:GNAT family N-acetyltransferase n=1 Tax=Bacillus spongiae TaxID=2683610 RepID=A0ABU8HFW2_9BACI